MPFPVSPLSVSATAALLAVLTGCATPSAPPPPAPAARSAIPLEVIQSGNGAPIHFETVQAAEALHVVARPTPGTEAHVDTHLLAPSGKVFSVALASIEASHPPGRPVVEFPLTEVARAEKIRVVYHTDARDDLPEPPDA